MTHEKKMLIYQIAGSERSLKYLFLIDKACAESIPVLRWLVKNGQTGIKFNELFEQFITPERFIAFVMQKIEKDPDRPLQTKDMKWGNNH